MISSDSWLGALLEFWDEIVHGDKVPRKKLPLEGKLRPTPLTRRLF